MRTASSGEEALLGERREVHGPNAGHLVHSDKGALEGVVQGIVQRMRDWERTNLVEPLPEVSVPELVAPGEGLEGALVDHRPLLKRRVSARHQVSPP